MSRAPCATARARLTRVKKAVIAVDVGKSFAIYGALPVASQYFNSSVGWYQDIIYTM